jgi:hypothetical protein
MDDFRHHVAARIVIVEVPSAGSPEPPHRTKPPPYKRGAPTHWRPQTRPPNRKAAGLERMLREFQRQDEIVRDAMRPNAALMQQWLSGRVLIAR